MKLDKQRKLQIPQFIREEKGFNPGDKILIVLEGDNFRLVKESNEKVVGCAKMDSKGRIVMPVYLKEHFVEKEIIFYISGGEEGVGLELKEMS